MTHFRKLVQLITRDEGHWIEVSRCIKPKLNNSDWTKELKILLTIKQPNVTAVYSGFLWRTSGTCIGDVLKWESMQRSVLLLIDRMVHCIKSVLISQPLCWFSIQWWKLGLKSAPPSHPVTSQVTWQSTNPIISHHLTECHNHRYYM